MSDENSESDDIEFNSELGSNETVSNFSVSPSQHLENRTCDFSFTRTENIVQSLFRREIGYGPSHPLRKTILKTYHLCNIFPRQVLQNHVFMGMTRCGRFLITYTMQTDQDDEEWYTVMHKYRLHWWSFKPGGQARKIAEVSLFGNHKIIAPLIIDICQWPKDNEKILIYGLMRECVSIDVLGPSANQHAFVTVTALPSINACQDCRTVASSYILDDIAASWDTRLRFSCLIHGFTVHTSFDVVVPYPDFSPRVSLKCNEYAVFNANNFLYALKITLGNCDKKHQEQPDQLPCQISLAERLEDGNRDTDESFPSCSVYQQNLNSSQKKALKLKEQIIQDFSEDVNVNALSLWKKTSGEDQVSFNLPTAKDEPKTERSGYDYLTSTPLPTRVNLTRPRSLSESHFGKVEGETSGEVKYENKDNGNGLEKDCFRCPMSPNLIKRVRGDQRKGNIDKNRGQEVFKNENNCSKKYHFSFFTRHKLQKNNLNFGTFIRNTSFAKSVLKSPKSLGEELQPSRHRARNSENAESAYEFVDDTQNEVEKLSQFRKKRLADKKYEFQDFDSENIVPFSMVRQENTLRSPKKFLETENELNIELRFGSDAVNSSDRNDLLLRSPSPRFPLDLTISVPSPRSPLILEILSSPNQYEGVLRPFNRNTNENMLSPMAKFLSSPPTNAHKPKQPTKDCWKAKGCDDVKSNKNVLGATKNSTTLDTRLILEKGILIHDVSEWYFQDEIDSEEEIYRNLFRNESQFHGSAVRFERKFIEVDDDELVSVITDIEDDDISAVTGYHTALNLEVHGAGYAQLQMVSNWKAEKLAVPCVVVDQQSLDIEGICHSVATTLCQVTNKTFTFCYDYDIEILDVCPRSGDVLVLLLMRIEGTEGVKDENSKIEQYEASVTLVWNLHRGSYRVCMVVPPRKVTWRLDSNGIWNPAGEASRKFKMSLPADITLCEPAVRICGNSSTLRGTPLSRIEDLDNGIQFVL